MDDKFRLDAFNAQVKIEVSDDDAVVIGADGQPWTYQPPKPQNLYDGSTDDEEFEIRMTDKIENEGGRKAKVARDLAGPAPDVEYGAYDLEKYKTYTLGQPAPGGEVFVPWQVVKKYPYTYIGTGNRQKVAERFFDQGKISDRSWDYFYLYRLRSDLNLQPIFLVPAKQVQDFLNLINETLDVQLAMPSGGTNGTFMVSFENDGTPRPRFLGRTIDKETTETIQNNVPPAYYKPKNEPKSTVTPTEHALEQFKAKIELMNAASKGKKTANKEKAKKERLFNQSAWKDSLKRTQRYLGLREASSKDCLPSDTRNLPWATIDALKAAGAVKAPTPSFDPDKLAPHPLEGRVVFVCVDIEAWERNNNIITEIGIATLDTDDIANVVPGEGGANWQNLVRARHFRIKENMHYNNTEFVNGCADRFEFGKSELINLKDAPRVVASCFKHPFSGLGDAEEPEEKRSVVLVGHDVGMDINYLKKLGYDVHNLSNLLETVDTANMWKYMIRDNQPRKLAVILNDLRLLGWNLHNAGNDAVYTLWAMIGITIKHLREHREREERKEAEKQKRIQESIAEAEKAATEREEGWSSEGSDGGIAITPIFPDAKNAGCAKTKNSKRTEPWRNENIPPRGSSYQGARRANNLTDNFGGPSGNQAVNNWLKNTQVKSALSAKAPEFNINPKRGRDINDINTAVGELAMSEKLRQKSRSPVFNPRGDEPFIQPTLPTTSNENNDNHQAQNVWSGETSTMTPRAPDPRWKTGGPLSPSLIESFSKEKQENEVTLDLDHARNSSRAKRRVGMALPKQDTDSTSDMHNLRYD